MPIKDGFRPESFATGGLMKDKFELGAEAGVAGGPSGPNTI
jgi:hypothetical protein